MYATEVLTETFIGAPLGGLLAGIAGIGFTVAFGSGTGPYLLAALALLFVHPRGLPAPTSDATISADIVEEARRRQDEPSRFFTWCAT